MNSKTEKIMELRETGRGDEAAILLTGENTFKVLRNMVLFGREEKTRNCQYCRQAIESYGACKYCGGPTV